MTMFFLSSVAMVASESRRATPDFIFSTEIRPITPDRRIVISGNLGSEFEIAVGYAENCPHRNCCPSDTFMRYEKLNLAQEHAGYSFRVPLKSKYGNPVAEVAIQTQAPFWEFYIPIHRLNRDEPNHLEIINQKLILLKNSSGVVTIVRGR